MKLSPEFCGPGSGLVADMKVPRRRDHLQVLSFRGMSLISVQVGLELLPGTLRKEAAGQ